MTDNELLKNINLVEDNIESGQLLLEGKPLLIVTEWNNQQMKCFNCLKTSFVMCTKCRIVPLCLFCTTHDQFECDFLSKALEEGISRDMLVKNYGIFPLFKLLLLMENPAKKQYCEQFLNQTIQLSDYEMNDLRHDYEESVINPLLSTGFLNKLTSIGEKVENYLYRLCILIDRNSIPVFGSDDDILKCIYPNIGEIESSCIPNAAITVDEQFNIRIFATVKIHAGSKISISNASPLMDTHERQLFYQSKRLLCKCERCMDPTELSTYISAIKCTVCEDGYMTFALGNTLWKCELCDSSSSISDIATLKSNIEDEINEASGDLATLESLLQKHSKILHANHFLLIRIKHNILMILNEVLFHKKTEELKERKIQLHEEILPIIRILSPGISKLYAFELHDYLSSFIQLDRNYISKEIVADKKNANKILNIMKEICKNLAYELPNTQEGVLFQQLLNVKKTIEAQLNSLK